MGIKFTKKEVEDENKERTVQSEEFVNLLMKFNKNTEQKKNCQGQKQISNEQKTTNRANF